MEKLRCTYGRLVPRSLEKARVSITKGKAESRNCLPCMRLEVEVKVDCKVVLVSITHKNPENPAYLDW